MKRCFHRGIIGPPDVHETHVGVENSLVFALFFPSASSFSHLGLPLRSVTMAVLAEANVLLASGLYPRSITLYPSRRQELWRFLQNPGVPHFQSRN